MNARRLLLLTLTLLITLGSTPWIATAQETPNAFTIPAWAFDRGNVKTFTTQYTGGGPMVAFGGVSPTFVEYDLELPVDAEWTISIQFASQGARPVDFWLDGKNLGPACRGVTASFDTSTGVWEKAYQLPVKQGKHTIKLVRPDAFPHVMALKFESSVPLPADWKPDRPKARKLSDPPPIIKAASAVVLDVNPKQLRLAIEDLMATFGGAYPNGDQFLARLVELDEETEQVENELAKGDASAAERDEQRQAALRTLRREALLANPLLDFDRLMLVKRGNRSPSLGLPRNWQSNSCLPKSGFDDEIAILSPVTPEGELTTLYRPEKKVFVGDVDLHFDGTRLLFSSVGANNRWQIFEIGVDGQGVRELTGEEPDVDSYDACYLPDGRIIFTSTAYFVGVPCVYGSSHVSVLYQMDAHGKNIRQLGFDQEHDWCPTVLNNGRVLYQRWEYTDTPHSNTRLLFHMNPDGTEQMQYYGSNSYWPNSTFYARAVPGHPTLVVGVIGGHHDNPRMGELVLFDPMRGRHEAKGAVQRIPGHGQEVQAIVSDGLTKSSWPKFLHPYPLSERHLLVSCKPSPQTNWGIYLVDTFDNFVLIKETPGYAMLEPTPLRRTPLPPIIPDKVNLAKKDAVIHIPNIYAGSGLSGVPPGTVKRMRVFSYHFAYQGMGGLLGVIGADGPWDMRRVVGSVPVNEDGSVTFRMPANLPVSLQPLDEEGKALQLMRSWMTAMPGEVVQCSGCHEKHNSAPARHASMAGTTRPVEIEPWRGPMRGFAFQREVQPVIDRHCVGCHNGEARPDGTTLASLRGDVRVQGYRSITPGNGVKRSGGRFSVGYVELCRYVRRPGIESDYHALEPMEYHADTTQLVQLLKKGHHGVKLDDEAWDRLYTWIDLNCPYHGTWHEELENPGIQRQRRRELLLRYANIDDDPEAVPETSDEPIVPIIPEQVVRVATPNLVCNAWPFDAPEAVRRQQVAATALSTATVVADKGVDAEGGVDATMLARRTVELAEGIRLELTLIPAGVFIMGSDTGYEDEAPRSVVRIDHPFWMGTCEITNAQYACYDPNHDSRVESKNAYQFGIHGYPMNTPEQPVVRLRWTEALDFCRWLSAKTGEPFTLPTEAQWEYACRAGSDRTFHFGSIEDDFSAFANLADATMTQFASNPYTVNQPLANPPRFDDWIPKATHANDGALLTIAPGNYQANPWGLHDMHGNAAEWTTSLYRPYPYNPADGREAVDASGKRVVRGGSWRDRPKRATSAYRWGYEPFQRVYNVSFRVVQPADGSLRVASE